MRESAGLEPLKDRNEKQDGFKCGMTVPGQRKTTRPEAHMTRLGDKPAANAGQPCPKGQNCGRMLALETVYDGYRLIEAVGTLSRQTVETRLGQGSG